MYLSNSIKLPHFLQNLGCTGKSFKQAWVSALVSTKLKSECSVEDKAWAFNSNNNCGSYSFTITKLAYRTIYVRFCISSL